MTRRRKAGVAIGAVLMVAVIAVTAFVWSAPTRSETVTDGAPKLETTTIQKTDLTNSQSFAGSLGYGDALTIKGSGKGVVTKLPTPASVVRRGAALFRMNDVPVPIFFGTTPLFRRIGGSQSIAGADIVVVARNLSALGYSTGIATSDPAKAKWTWRATEQLRKWQRHVGLEPTGTLDVGQVVVVPGVIRINSVTAQLGDPVAEDLMTVTSTTKTVMFNAQAADIGGIRAGADVTIVRPDNQRVPAKVTTIGATVPKDGEETDGSPSFSVTVAPEDAHQLDGLDFAAVQIEVVTERRTGVLAVPVSALVALREGGYALQLPNGRYVSARTGMFSRSLVEVSGEGIANGLEVVTVP